MNKNKWIWMPHAGHFLLGNKCQFRLNTYVGKYIVSTVGEYLPDEGIREILNKTRNLELQGMGDEREADFLKKNGWEKVGYNRKYETMVFKAKKSNFKCCPFTIKLGEIEMNGYNDAESAYRGHLKMCNKYAKK